MNIFISLAVATVLVMVLVKLFPTLFSNREKRTRDVIGRIYTETGEVLDQRNTAAIKSDHISDNPEIDALLRKIPGVEKTHLGLRKAGMKISTGTYLLWIAGVFVLFMMFFRILGWSPIIGIIAALFIAVYGSSRFLVYKREKRSLDFINNFPDAVDMIVRSVRSGHPISAALNMIADNMDAPIGEEFKQVVDEVAYGRSMTEALMGMANRVDEQDVRFFVVVLNVQQETGGNLGEVLTNLSGILRKRKQMRLKIRALTSEGRMTAYILGALPFFVMGMLQLVSPDYLIPLFKHTVGNLILGMAIILITSAFLIVRRMIKIDI